jgi:hypothetical protein
VAKSPRSTKPLLDNEAIYGSNFANELRAAFIQSNLTQAERDIYRQKGWLDASSIVGNTGTNPRFDLTSFAERAGKKNFGEYFSRQLANRFSLALSHWFDGILPDVRGKGHESKARTGKGYKKLDVNYSTPALGLGLGVSIKTANSRDPKSKRFNKNITRIDAELRAESADYHERQPYAVMVAVVCFPMAACQDQTQKTPSTFGAAVRSFRHRAGRRHPSDSHMLFERVYIGLYETDDAAFGKMVFLDVASAPPRSGPPQTPLSFLEVVKGIVAAYDERNKPPFAWAEDGMTASPEEQEEEEAEISGDEDGAE